MKPDLPPLNPTTYNTYTYTDSEWGDLLTSYNGTAITYDAIGNPLSYYNGLSYTFTWNGRRLATATKGTKSMSFAYNSDGLRISKTVNGVTRNYVYDGDLLVSEYTDSDTIVYIYNAYGSPIGFKYRTSTYADDAWDTYWYGKNLQGDIVAIYGSDGTLLVSYKYTAWGETTRYYSNGGGTTTAAKNNLTYRGYYYDSDLSMYYLQSRYYDPVIGRFINADSILVNSLLGYNLFAYCLNNPVNRVDPTGHFADYVDFDENYDFLDDPDLYGGSGGAYGSYLIKQHTSYTDSVIGGYYHSGISSTYGNYGYYNVGGGWTVTDNMATTTHCYYTISGNPVISNSYPSTGRTTPKNLTEKLAMEEVKSDPFNGYQIKKIKMGDDKFPASRGWVKMQKIVPTSKGKINIHYLYNFKWNIYTDFKFNDN